jgi:hypothetical protein
MTRNVLRSFVSLNICLKFALLAFLLLLPMVQGCKKPDGPPPPISLEQLPAALEKAFAKAKPEAGEPLTTLQGALREKDFSKALMAMQAIAALPGLNKEQANVAAAGLVSINNALQEAQSQGDQNAAKTLQTYRATK